MGRVRLLHVRGHERRHRARRASAAPPPPIAISRAGRGRAARTHLMSPAMVAAAAVTGHLTDARALLRGGRHEAARHRSRRRACPLPLANVDTDQIIPARFMKRPRSEGYGAFLLHDLRQRPGCARRLPRRSQGTGARRCWSPGAISAAARRARRRSTRSPITASAASIAPSFGDIFASNAVKNGLLPARVREDRCRGAARERGRAGGQGDRASTSPAQTITARQPRRCLRRSIPCGRPSSLNGWDDIDLTLAQAAEIERFARGTPSRGPGRRRQADPPRLRTIFRNRFMRRSSPAVQKFDKPGGVTSRSGVRT